MQEEVENRTLTLVVSGSKFTGRMFKAAVAKYMAHRKEKKLEKQRSRDVPVIPHGKQTSHSLNYQKLGKELMSQDELAVMDGGKCILQLRGVRPFLSDKFDITKHPNFQYTADADPKNTFDIEAFLSARLKLRPNEVCDVYEVDAGDGE